MKQTIFVTSKNKDLQALSGHEVIKKQLGQTQVKRLDRFDCYEVELEPLANAHQKLKQILTESYYLANTNKEFYYLNKLPKLPQGLHYHLVAVSPKEPVDYSNMIGNIKRYFDTSIKKLTHQVLWVIGSDTKQSTDQIEESIIISSSQKKGLLVNPISHQFRYLNLTDFV